MEFATIDLPRLIQPVGAYTLHGLTWQTIGGKPYAISLDTYQGHLLRIDPFSEGATVLNIYTAKQFRDATDFAVSGDTVWVALARTIYYCNTTDYELEPFLELPDPIEGIAVSEGAVYVSSKTTGKIFAIGRATRGLLRVMNAPGSGEESLCLRGEELWVSDRMEETVYCMEAKTGLVKYRALTPFSNAVEDEGFRMPTPSGLGFCDDRLYVVYTGDEHYVEESPNDVDPYSVQVRTRTFLHRMQILRVTGQKPCHTLSNGYLVEMVYLEELSSEEPQAIQNLNWRIALPADTDRQKLIAVEPMGMPFEENAIDGQRIAVFKLGNLRPEEAKLFGWKALLELRGIKYDIVFEDFDEVPPLSPEMQSIYLIDDDGLSMDSPYIIAAAQEAVGEETNILRKMLAIRDYVYDRLKYRVVPYIDNPETVMQRGTGSCGEYVGVLLALARLNGIACRTVGRYKCPPYADLFYVPMEQRYNHVWIEFYVPGLGWLPMESNPDDIGDRPYPTRWFLGLPWYHVEIAKGITFETIRPQPFSIGEIAVNHVRFKILREL